jgi:hypothetical protein
MDETTQALFNAMHVDGGRLTWVHNGNDIHFQRKERIYDALKTAGLSDKQCTDAVKMDVVISGKKDKRYLDVCWLTGNALVIVLTMHPHWWRNVTELHSKAYLVARDHTSNNQFVDAIWQSKLAATVATFRGVPSSSSRRSSGQKGARIGNPKSDTHTVIYQAKNEKTGIEQHVKGRAIQNVKRDVDVFFAGAQGVYSEEDHKSMFIYQCHKRAATRIMKQLRAMGINITDYFYAASAVSWTDALYDDTHFNFNAGTEAAIVELHAGKAKGQLQMDFTEGDAA